MSYPILYPASQTEFNTNGIGILSSAVSVIVKRELNGIYELEMQYPVTGLHFDEIADNCILLAKPAPMSAMQPFRIYQITKPFSGITTVYARHLAYDLMGIPVSPFAASSAVLALDELAKNVAVDCPFEFYTDLSAQGEFSVDVPMSIWECLGSSEGSILETFGGEFDFDGKKVSLLAQLGTDCGVNIRYGKNLTTLEQDRNCANVYTGIYPYWVGDDGSIAELPDKVVNMDGTYAFNRIRPVDLTDLFEEAPTEDQLREAAFAYMEEYEIGIPTVSWKVSFVQLEQTVEYKGKALLEQVLLGDTVSVEFPKMGISASARAVEYEFNSILERYESVTLGSIHPNIADTIATQKKELAAKPGMSQLQQAAAKVTASILGATGGAVRLLDTDGDGVPDTLYIADNPDPNLAVKVWRFNYEGWAASEDGYSGTFELGATLNDGILAHRITAGTLNANLIKTGVLKSQDENFVLDLDEGTLTVGAANTGSVSLAGYATSNELGNLDSELRSQRSQLEGTKDTLMQLKTSSDNLSVQFYEMAPNGIVQEVRTTSGYTFGADGLRIVKPGRPVENLLTHDGMYVSNAGENILTADEDGVKAVDISVKNYLIIGNHSRLENYNNGSDDKRTALFWIG